MNQLGDDGDATTNARAGFWWSIGAAVAAGAVAGGIALYRHLRRRARPLRGSARLQRARRLG